jgi:hypothetical protein
MCEGLTRKFFRISTEANVRDGTDGPAGVWSAGAAAGVKASERAWGHLGLRGLQISKARNSLAAQRFECFV